MNTALRCAVLSMVTAALVPFGPVASAACGIQTEIGEVVETCDYSSIGVAEEKAKYPTAVWSVRQICKDDSQTPEGACFNPQECTTADGVPGTRYVLYRDGEVVGTACLTAGEAGEVDDPPPIRVLVLRAFENLDWSESILVVQPPGGRTLVNLDTNFYTDNSDFTVIPVTLVQSEVRVQAEPISYTWHFGDGVSETTTSPGAPYPDLDVAHVYESADAVVVRVDTTYGNASFSVGGGAWEAIPSTITIPGAESDLDILEAKPQLVIR